MWANLEVEGTAAGYLAYLDVRKEDKNTGAPLEASAPCALKDFP